MNLGYDVQPRFPGGKRKALVMSYDDGSEHDRRLVEIFNRYGIRATFHLNSGRLDSPHYVSQREVRTLYAGHEVACHTVNHPDLTALSASEVHREVWQDRAYLEDLLGQPVRGLAYPYGKYNAQAKEVVAELHMAYGRTTHITGSFGLPRAPLALTTTGHHNLALVLGERFLAEEGEGLAFMYLWGHSYELDGFMSGDHTKDWQYMAAFCRLITGGSDIYYGTTVEVLDYLDGMRQLAWSVRPRRLHNRSAVSLWVSWRKRCFEIPPGGEIPIPELPQK